MMLFSMAGFVLVAHWGSKNNVVQRGCPSF
jgi:hypothetical protein